MLHRGVDHSTEKIIDSASNSNKNNPNTNVDATTNLISLIQLSFLIVLIYFFITHSAISLDRIFYLCRRWIWFHMCRTILKTFKLKFLSQNFQKHKKQNETHHKWFFFLSFFFCQGNGKTIEFFFSLSFHSCDFCVVKG